MYTYDRRLTKYQNRVLNRVQRIVDAHLENRGYNGVDIETLAIELNMGYRPLLWLVHLHGDKKGLYYSDYACEARRDLRFMQEKRTVE